MGTDCVERKVLCASIKIPLHFTVVTISQIFQGATRVNARQYPLNEFIIRSGNL